MKRTIYHVTTPRRARRVESHGFSGHVLLESPRPARAVGAILAVTIELRAVTFHTFELIRAPRGRRQWLMPWKLLRGARMRRVA